MAAIFTETAWNVLVAISMLGLVAGTVVSLNRKAAVAARRWFVAVIILSVLALVFLIFFWKVFASSEAAKRLAPPSHWNGPR